MIMIRNKNDKTTKTTVMITIMKRNDKLNNYNKYENYNRI